MSKQKWTLVLVALIVVVIILIKYVSGMAAKPIDSNEARMEGPSSAKVQIVEFVDFQCPSCAMGYKILKEYMQKYPNDIRVQLKYFPLYRAHTHAKMATLYSECAARQNKFWPFVDKLFSTQQQWTPMINADSMYQTLAKESDIDIKTLNICLVTESTMQDIEKDRKLGETLAVSSTPTYFINNKMVVGTKSLQEELNNHFPAGK